MRRIYIIVCWILLLLLVSGCAHPANKIMTSATGSGSAQAPKPDGSVQAGGSKATGQPGNASLDGSLVPVQVHGLNHITAIAAGNGNQDGNLGNSAAYALKSDGSVWAP